jgi:dTDP-4-dehydrorhamnose 3,5-epimerase
MGKVDLSMIGAAELKKFPTSTGTLMQGIRSDDKNFLGFGEIYFAWATRGALGDWKMHTKMIMNLIVPMGTIALVFVDREDESSYRVEVLGERRNIRLTVPPGIWFSYMGIGDGQNMLVNVSNILHSPSEICRRPITDIVFDWNSL